METLLTIVLIYILCRIVFDMGKRKGIRKANADLYKEGFKEGKNTIEKEIHDLSFEDEKEIIKRLRNFANNYSKKEE